ncbi:MAG: hypothetical protein GY859_07005, partial [Desulfobacterales bacterium]|nr:hypothetical protein [Desulfobacterales bacterium]
AGAHRLQSEGEAHRRALMLIPLVKERARESPEQLVHSMFTALNAILPHGPDAALAWISRMRKALPHCDAMADVLNAGRLCAWRSGLAHLRERALAAARELPPEAASGALNTPANAGLLQRMEENPWFSPGKTGSADAGSGGLVFRCRMGGFRGFGGPFLKPPAVARVEQCFVASDGESGCAVFADCFGASVVNQAPATPSEIADIARKTDRSSPAAPLIGGPDPLTDVRTRAFDGRTLILSRDSSHFLYIYGAS